MQMSTIDPAVLAELVAAVPARLKKRLDGDPRLARAWAWTATPDGIQVVTDGGEAVSAPAHVVTSVQQLVCTCLLSPRCLHILAVASLFDLAEPVAPTAAATEASAAAPAEQAKTPLTPEQVAAAERLWRVAADTLAIGADGAGTVILGQWLRAIHEARSVGLHGPTQSALAVLRQLRASRLGDADFSPADLCAAWLSVLSVGRSARSGQLPPASIGQARRAYAATDGRPVRLHGVFCEPLRLRGLGGCATWLCDDKGRLWCLRDARQADAGRDVGHRALQVAEAGIAWGGATISHRQLARAGLFVQGFAASDSGRLGGERGVRAASAEGTSWTAPPLSRLFDCPLPEQLARAWRTPAEREGDSLLFMRASVVAADGDGLVLSKAGEPWQLRAWLTPSSAGSPVRDNLLQLAKTAGVELWWVGRWSPDRPGGIDPLAVGGPALSLPDEWAGRACLGYDRLQGAMMPASVQLFMRARPHDQLSPLAPIERWSQQVALAGSTVLRHNEGAPLHRDADRLARHGICGGAAALRGLAQARAGNADELAGAWLTAGLYLDRARKRIAFQLAV